uniref:hypothetical protein n=1 Tax=Alteromonas sp. S167 TaxID=3117402 RepID=UPI002FDF84A7
MKSEAVTFFKGVFLGGFFSLVAFGFLLGLIVQLDQKSTDLASVVLCSIGLVVFSLATLWGAGFWGRWWLVGFFAFAPVILIVDFTLNPFFPAGTIIIAVLCSSKKGRKSERT